MAAGHQRRGVPTLLFDRLVSRDAPPGRAGRLPPSDVYDRDDLGERIDGGRRRTIGDELRASIAEQLGWLLNTRVPVDYATLDARTRAGTRTTLDYGLPDLTVYPVGDVAAQARLCLHIAQTIAWYEPRLADPVVTIVESRRQGGLLTVAVGGTITIGLIATPVRFELGITVGEGGGGH